MMHPRDFFELDDFEFRAVFQEDQPVWNTLDTLQEFIHSHFKESWPLSGISGMIEKPIVLVDGEIKEGLDIKPIGPKAKMKAFDGEQQLENASIIMPGAYLFDDQIIIGPGTVIEPGALLKGPMIAGKNSEFRQGAYVRGDCLFGDKCVIGHTTEVKAAIMLDGAQAGHFAYIGDSILGKNVNLGAGTKLANLKMIAGNISVRIDGKRHDTGRRKIGGILGDSTETGCNSVTSPGTFMGPGSIIYPTLAVPGGYYPGKTVFRPRKDTIQIMSRSR